MRGSASFNNDLSVTGPYSSLSVRGPSSFSSSATFNDISVMSGAASFSGISVTGPSGIDVTGTATLDSLNVGGSTSLNSLSVMGPASLKTLPFITCLALITTSVKGIPWCWGPRFLLCYL